MSRINKNHNPTGRPTNKVRQRKKAAESQKPIKPPLQQQGAREEKLINILDEKQIAYKAYRLLIQGYTVEEIVVELDTSETTLNAALLKAQHQLDSETAFLQLNWQKVWISRTETLVKTMFKELTEGTRKLDRDFKDMLKGFFDMQTIVMDTGPKTPMTQNNLFVQTMDPQTELWKRGQARMQMNHTGKTMPELVEYIEDPEIRELDDLLDDD